MRNLVAIFFIIALLMLGCESQTQSGYASYNQPQQQQDVRGGCGVAPAGDYSDTPINVSADSAI